MAKIKKRIYGPALLPLTDTAMFTATSPTEIYSIWVSNPSGASRTLRMSVGADGATTRFLSDVTVAAGFQGTLAYPGIVLQATEILRGQVSVADVNVIVMGIIDQTTAT
ncbi:MAG: hypothetical protein HOP09_14765 [Hyphomicrobium sp.]|nr:hypothetical protein [Hyphomicrobium sp.]